ncbi:unnamed protein product [marine sediment metagenome]|uniref:Uncharacterized protein n=1 Tax=marine sediment metagenome TaxID=412755 RepID=X0RZX2_9ZZZZ
MAELKVGGIHVDFSMRIEGDEHVKYFCPACDGQYDFIELRWIGKPGPDKHNYPLVEMDTEGVAVCPIDGERNGRDIAYEVMWLWHTKDSAKAVGL